MFSVKVPPIAGPSWLAGTVVVTTISPKLVPAGVFTGSVVPLKVIVVVPLTLVKFTTFVPLTLKTPVVLNVTGSAWATAAVNARTTAPNNGIKAFRKLISIYLSSSSESETQAPQIVIGTPRCLAGSTLNDPQFEGNRTEERVFL